jgi:hypothetical protein
LHEIRESKALAMVATNITESQLDRWFYATMAIVFASAAIVGFTPNSLAILAGTKENPQLIVHFHAVAMSSWLLLLSTQAILVASGNLRFHKRLGIVSLVLAPIMVAIMIMLAFRQFQGGVPDALVVIQIKRVTLFSSFYLLAFIARKHDSEAHKRLMFLATFVVMDAAFNRMLWFLPDIGFRPSIPVLALVLLVPLLAYDWIKTGRLHRVYIIGIPVILAFSVLTIVLWPS